MYKEYIFITRKIIIYEIIINSFFIMLNMLLFLELYHPIE